MDKNQQTGKAKGKVELRTGGHAAGGSNPGLLVARSWLDYSLEPVMVMYALVVAADISRHDRFMPER
jgi:hypothetical protein